jgi:hypothetical protein
MRPQQVSGKHRIQVGDLRAAANAAACHAGRTSRGSAAASTGEVLSAGSAGSPGSARSRGARAGIAHASHVSGGSAGLGGFEVLLGHQESVALHRDVDIVFERQCYGVLKRQIHLAAAQQRLDAIRVGNIDRRNDLGIVLLRERRVPVRSLGIQARRIVRALGLLLRVLSGGAPRNRDQEHTKRSDLGIEFLHK